MAYRQKNPDADFRAELTRRYDEINAEKQRCRSEIAELEERIRWYEQQQSALVMVANLPSMGTGR